MYREKIIPIFALVIIIIGSLSTLYVYAVDNNIGIENEVIINEISYDLIYLIENSEIRIFEDFNISGIALDDIIMRSGVDCPSCNNYKIIGADGYSQTLTWDNMQNGLLTIDGKVVFINLPKAFNVKDVVKIEVV